jgi:3-oxoacyl-[acyl-carrier protein] reductase
MARDRGATAVLLPGDLTDPAEPDRLDRRAVGALGPLRGLVLSHAESRDSGILDTTVESFDRT